MSEEKEKTYKVISYFIGIRHVQQPSTSTHTTNRSCRVGLNFDPTTLTEITVNKYDYAGNSLMALPNQNIVLLKSSKLWWFRW